MLITDAPSCGASRPEFRAWKTLSVEYSSVSTTDVEVVLLDALFLDRCFSDFGAAVALLAALFLDRRLSNFGGTGAVDMRVRERGRGEVCTLLCYV